MQKQQLITNLAFPGLDSSRFIPTPEAAEFLGLAASTLETDRTTNALKIPYYRFGRAIRYCRRELEAWANERRRLHTSQPTNGEV